MPQQHTTRLFRRGQSVRVSRGLKLRLGIVLATAAIGAALPASNAMAGQCSSGGTWYAEGTYLGTAKGGYYVCTSFDNVMYWLYLGTSPGTGRWQP
jgi:hypothetical protein